MTSPTETTPEDWKGLSEALQESGVVAPFIAKFKGQTFSDWNPTLLMILYPPLADIIPSSDLLSASQSEFPLRRRFAPQYLLVTKVTKWKMTAYPITTYPQQTTTKIDSIMRQLPPYCHRRIVPLSTSAAHLMLPPRLILDHLNFFRPPLPSSLDRSRVFIYAASADMEANRLVQPDSIVPLSWDIVFPLLDFHIRMERMDAKEKIGAFNGPGGKGSWALGKRNWAGNNNRSGGATGREGKGEGSCENTAGREGDGEATRQNFQNNGLQEDIDDGEDGECITDLEIDFDFRQLMEIIPSSVPVVMSVLRKERLAAERERRQQREENVARYLQSLQDDPPNTKVLETN